MVEKIQEFLVALSIRVPVEWFAVIASFLEEIVAPIPSPLVGAFVGSLAHTSSYEIVGALLFLGFLMALGKTLACGIIYEVMRYASKATAEHLERFFGIRHEDLIAAGGYFTGTIKNYILLILARAIPFIPSSPISILAGIIKAPLLFYLLATFIGSFIRSMLFIYIGYAGYSGYLQATEYLPHIEVIFFALGSVLIVGYVLWLYNKSSDKK